MSHQTKTSPGPAATPRGDRLSTELRRSADDQLMARVATGDAVAFGELYDRFGPRAHRVARSVCRSGGTAEDAVQDAFLSIWKSRATYQAHRGSVAAWLLTIVRRRSLDMVRRRSALDQPRAADAELDSRTGACDVAEEAVVHDDQAEIRSQLARLPAGQLEVITLSFFGELTHAEIAAHLDLPVGTVKSRMRLGLAKLRGTAVR